MIRSVTWKATVPVHPEGRDTDRRAVREITDIEQACAAVGQVAGSGDTVAGKARALRVSWHMIMRQVRAPASRVARRYAVLRPCLDERQHRLVPAAAELGRGGITAVAQATRVYPDTVAKGVRELG